MKIKTPTAPTPFFSFSFCGWFCRATLPAHQWRFLFSHSQAVSLSNLLKYSPKKKMVDMLCSESFDFKCITGTFFFSFLQSYYKTRGLKIKHFNPALWNSPASANLGPHLTLLSCFWVSAINCHYTTEMCHLPHLNMTTYQYEPDAESQ